MYLYSYAHSIVRHKRVLLYLAPKLKHDLIFIERLYRNACLKMLRYCDTMDSLSQPEWTVFLLALIYEELVILNPEQMDSSLLQHLLIAVSSRLTIFSNRLLDLDRSKKSKFTPHGGLADFCYNMQESRLYPRSKDFYDRIALASRNMVSPQQDANRLHSASCLLSRSDRNECDPDVTHPDGCCCGWTFDSIPSGFLAIFGQCSESLARHFHAKRWTIRFAEWTSDVDMGALMKEVFEKRDMEKSTLPKKQVIFREALYLSLQLAFRSLTLINPILPIITTEDQLDFRAYENSQLLLDRVLQKAVFLYRRFWESRDKEYPDARGIDELILDFCSWGKCCPGKDTVDSELGEILIPRAMFISAENYFGVREH